MAENVQKAWPGTLSNDLLLWIQTKTSCNLFRSLTVCFRLVMPFGVHDTRTTSLSTSRPSSNLHQQINRHTCHERAEAIARILTPTKKLVRGMRRGIPRGQRSQMKSVVASDLHDADEVKLATSSSSGHR